MMGVSSPLGRLEPQWPHSSSYLIFSPVRCKNSKKTQNPHELGRHTVSRAGIARFIYRPSSRIPPDIFTHTGFTSQAVPLSNSRNNVIRSFFKESKDKKKRNKFLLNKSCRLCLCGVSWQQAGAGRLHVPWDGRQDRPGQSPGQSRADTSHCSVSLSPPPASTLIDY